MSWKDLSAPEKKIFLQLIVCIFIGIFLVALMSISIEGIVGMVILSFYMSWLNMMHFIFSLKIKKLEEKKDP